MLAEGRDFYAAPRLNADSTQVSLLGDDLQLGSAVCVQLTVRCFVIT